MRYFVFLVSGLVPRGENNSVLSECGTNLGEPTSGLTIYLPYKSHLKITVFLRFLSPITYRNSAGRISCLY